MESLDLSLGSLGVDENDLLSVDPIAAAQALHRTINEMTDGEVAIRVLRHGLNIRSDARVLRNRLERHQMRRHFGCGAALWNPVMDERSETHEPRLILSSPPESSNLVGRFPQARVFEIPTSTGIFRPNAPATLDVKLERLVSNVAADEISDRSKLNCQPRAPSTRCPLICLCAAGSGCFSPSSMNTTRVVRVPITAPPCSTAESAPVHASPIRYSTFLSKMPASSRAAVQVTEMSNENSNAAPAVDPNPSLSRSCSEISFIRADEVRPPATKLSPSFPSYGGFVKELEIARQPEVLSHSASMDCQCSLKVKQISKTLYEVREVLEQLKLSLRLGKQLNRPYHYRSSSFRPYPDRKLLDTYKRLKSLGEEGELRRATPEEYRTPPPPDESFLRVPVNATAKLRRQAKWASRKPTGTDLLPGGTPKSLAAISPTSVAEADLSPITSLRVKKLAKRKRAKLHTDLCKRFKQPRNAKAEAVQFEEVLSPGQKQGQVRFRGVSPQARNRERQPRWNKDHGRAAHRRSKGRSTDQNKEFRAKSTKKATTPEPSNIEVVHPSGKFEDMQRKKMREPCFRCGQAGHWRRECMNAAVCQNCGQPNTTARKCSRCNPASDLTPSTSDAISDTSDLTLANYESNSQVHEISAIVANSEEDHPQVQTPNSLMMRSAISNVEPRLFFNIELNGRKLLGMLDDGSVIPISGKASAKNLPRNGNKKQLRCA